MKMVRCVYCMLGFKFRWVEINEHSSAKEPFLPIWKHQNIGVGKNGKRSIFVVEDMLNLTFYENWKYISYALRSYGARLVIAISPRFATAEPNSAHFEYLRLFLVPAWKAILEYTEHIALHCWKAWIREEMDWVESCGQIYCQCQIYCSGWWRLKIFSYASTCI